MINHPDNNSPTNPSSKEVGPALEPVNAYGEPFFPDKLLMVACDQCSKAMPWPLSCGHIYIRIHRQEYTRTSAEGAGAMVDAVKVAERIVIYLAGKYIDPSAGSMEVQPIADIIAAAVPRNEAAVDADRLWEVLRAECCKSDKAELIVFLSRKKFNKALARLSSDNS